MKFIKVHTLQNDIVNYVNYANIDVITQLSTGANIYFSGSEIPLTVKESADDICKMISQKEWKQ